MFTAQQVAQGVALHVAGIFKGRSKQANRGFLIAKRKFLASQSFPNDLGGYVRREKKPELPIKLRAPRELFRDLVQAFTDPANLKLIQPPGKARRHRTERKRIVNTNPSSYHGLRSPAAPLSKYRWMNVLGHQCKVALDHLCRAEMRADEAQIIRTSRANYLAVHGKLMDFA
jgi:hypothetical protein